MLCFAGRRHAVRSVPQKPLDKPPAVAHRFDQDMRAFHAEKNSIKQDEIAGRQLHALRQYYTGKLRLADVKDMFLQMEDPY
jgi:hypothetical protein